VIESVEAVAYGRPATEALAGAVRRAKAAAGSALAPVTVVVPSNLAGLSARRLLGSAALGGSGIANVAFLTPFRLAELLAADLLLDRRPLTNPVLGAAVRRALATAPGPFAAVAGHHATEQAVAALHAELSTLDEPALERLRRRGGPSAASAVAVHRAVAGHLGGFHDETDVARAAADRPDLATALSPFGHLVWFLPAPTTAPLVGLLGAALDAAPATVLVGVTGDPEADGEVRAMCGRAGVLLPETADDHPRVVPSADRIISVTDADEEVRAVVRAIVTLAEGGVPLDRIGVFHPVPDPYTALLEQHLGAAGLPHNGPSRRRLADHVAGRTLLDALALPGHRWRRDRVMALVAGAPVRACGGPVEPGAWEQLSREAGVVQGLDDWHRKLATRGRLAAAELERAGGFLDDGARHRLERTVAVAAELGHFVAELAVAVRAVEEAQGWGAKSAAARQLLTHLLGRGEHTGWPEPEQQAFARVEDALVRLGALASLEPSPSHEVFQRALAAELDVTAGRSGRFGCGVLHGPLVSASGLDLDAVFVLGCREGLCPVGRRDDGLLPEAARSLLPGELTGRAGRMAEQHRAFLAALAAGAPGGRVLTFARGDLRSGRHALPSRWLLDSAGARVGRPVHATDFDGLGAPVVDVVPSFATGLLAAPSAASLGERDLAAVARHVRAGGCAVAHRSMEPVRRGLQAQAARRSSAFTEWDGNLAGHPIPSTGDRPLSPSRLEMWAACGYRYFLTHVLGIGPRDEPERVVELHPLDRGSGTHAVLERFVRDAIACGVPEPDEPWSPAQRLQLRRIAEAVFDELDAEGRTGRPVLWRVRRENLLHVLDAFLDADDDHRARRRARPEAVELAFGIDGAPPVELALPDGRTLAFRGRIDRIDRAEDGRLLVSDYKTGNGKRFEHLEDDPVLAGRTLQLALYAEAARRRYGVDEVDTHYWMVDPEAGYRRLGYPWTAERRARFTDVVTAIVDGIEGGVFNAVPGEWDGWRRTNQNCVHCTFNGVCGSDRGEQAEAKHGAPPLAVRSRLEAEVS
jgi:ATP-dependent helicase/nuclease subunit B